MKRTTLVTMFVFVISLLAVSALAQGGFGPGEGTGVCQFIDEDGDGFNDLAPDADGDGIPNGLDEDYVRPLDGTGGMFHWGQIGELLLKSFGEAMGNSLVQNGQQHGLGDGTGSGVGPADGTGFGPGTGDCLEGDTTESSAVQQRRGGRR